MNNTISCPICRSATTLDDSNLFRPFCSDRCRLVDLGKWVDEKYSITNFPEMNEDKNYSYVH
jgi:endogenous inhibitor of DNA gyrase (YacG/DUF329 family)